MLKYCAAIVLVFGLALYVSSQYKQHAQTSASRAQQPADNTPSSTANKNPKAEVGQAEWNPPRWYRLFSWPEGIGVWGLFLTLIVIAEQTRETRKAAEATQIQAEISRKAFISQNRPQLHIRTMRITELGGHLMVEIWVVNKGSTSAQITGGTVTAIWKREEGEQTTVQSETLQPSSMEAGQEYPLALEISQIAVPYHVGKIAVEEKEIDQRAWVFCIGTIAYRDANGTERRTGFSRRHDMKSDRFIPSSDSEVEYED